MVKLSGGGRTKKGDVEVMEPGQASNAMSEVCPDAGLPKTAHQSLRRHTGDEVSQVFPFTVEIQRPQCHA